VFPSLNDNDTTPSKEFTNFTNRVVELEAFNRLLKIPHGEDIPCLSFYGVGGIGKTWLLKHFHLQSAALPTAFIDLDSNSGGQSYQQDPARALGEIRRQLGSSLKCPRFDLAYTWLRFHQGVNDEPLFKGSGVLGNTWEFIVEAGSVAANDISSVSLITWGINKCAPLVKTRLGENGVGDWIATKLGQEDFLTLKGQLPDDIYPQLHKRLLQDLQEHLPTRDDCTCRAIVFIDTLESIRSYRASDESLFEAQRWLRELYHPQSGLLIIIGGRDRLNWDKDPTAPFAKKKHLEQHLVGGLSATDAKLFLTRCGIDSPALQQAILTVSIDQETSQTSEKSEEGYHPFSLGLCADTCQNLTRQEASIDPALFDMSNKDTRELAARFLRSMGGDGTYAEWLKRLALTTQFDEAAARACFSDNPGREQDFAWNTLSGYSFIRQTQTPGWFALHARMKESLVEIQHADNEARWHDSHQWWHSYWTKRSENHFAAKAWYHHWCIEPVEAAKNWKQRIETAIDKLQMQAHYELLDWWTPCALKTQLSNVEHNFRTAITLFKLGAEFHRASLGDRDANLQHAIDCYETALRVFTKATSPKLWAATQNNLAIVYSDLPSKTLSANLQRAIGCYKAALQVFTEVALPKDWATTQNNLANAYSVLPSGDLSTNLQQAIDCYEAALRVRTEVALPKDWATTQNNLGLAYSDLPLGDRGTNLLCAIDCYEAALRVRTKATFPKDWATTQNNLAVAYTALPFGDRGTNLKRAFDYCEAALRVRTETAFPQDWAATQNNLAIAYSNLSSGDHSANLLSAIDCYKASLRVRTEAAFPQDWATTQNNLAVAYSRLLSGNRAANLQRAIDCCEAALRIRTETAFPKLWAATQNNLAAAYSDLPSKDRTINLQRAINGYKAALRVRTETDSPQDWAATQPGHRLW